MFVSHCMFVSQVTPHIPHNKDKMPLNITSLS